MYGVEQRTVLAQVLAGASASACARSVAAPAISVACLRKKAMNGNA